MEEWGLNTDSPHPPDWLQVDLPDTGDGAGQPDDEVGDSGKPPVIKEPPKKAIQAYRLSILKGWSQEKIAVELGTNQGRVWRWLTATKGDIEAGADFSTQAKEHSSCPSARPAAHKSRTQL